MYKNNIFLGVTLILTSLVLFPSLRNDWISLDDPTYILDNPLISDLSWMGIQNMFTTFHVNGSYNPIVLISWGLDYKIAGLDAWIFHVTNLMLHLLAVILVYCFIRLLSDNKWVAFGTSLLFGIHPMHVEAVAWISSRKDLLYTIFYLAGLITYLFYQKKESKYPRWWYWLLCFLLYILSLFSKGSAITFPLILWALDYLNKRKGIKRILIEKIPFLILSVVFTYISIKAQDIGEALNHRAFYSVFDSLSVGFYGYLDYIIKVFVPYRLCILHPYPTLSGTPSPWYFSASAIPILGIATYCVLKIKTYRKLVFGFAFFFITLIPVIQVLSFAISVTADRFTYLPYVGLFYIISLGVVWLQDHWPSLKILIRNLTIGYIMTMGLMTFSYSQTFKNAETLWSRVISYYPDYFVSYINRAEFRIKGGQLLRALEDCNTGILLKPDYFLGYYNRAIVYEEQEKLELAIQDYTKTIALDSNSVHAYQNRGIIYAKLNRLDEALEDFEMSISIKPKDPFTYLNRGALYEKKQMYKKAIADVSIAISIKPVIYQAYYIRAKSYNQLGQKEKAIADFSTTLHYNPKMVFALVGRGDLYMEQGRSQEAYQDFTKAIELDDRQVKAYLQRGVLSMNLSKYKNALSDFNKVQKLTPGNPKIYLYRGVIYREIKNYKKALQDIQKCLQLDPDNKEAKKENILIEQIMNTIQYKE